MYLIHYLYSHYDAPNMLNGWQNMSSPIGEELVYFKDIFMWLAISTCILIIYLLIIVNKINLFPIRNFNHNYFFKILWTISPAIILLILSYLRFKLLYMMDNTSEPSMIVKAIGHQWNWSCELDYNLLFDNDEFKRIILTRGYFYTLNPFYLNELYILAYIKVKKVKFITPKLWDRHFYDIYNREIFPYLGFMIFDNDRCGIKYRRKTHYIYGDDTNIYSRVFTYLLYNHNVYKVKSKLPNIIYIYKFDYHITKLENSIPKHFNVNNILKVSSKLYNIDKLHSLTIIDDKGGRILEFRSIRFIRKLNDYNVFLDKYTCIETQLKKFYSIAHKYFNK